jgi:lipopolysaccharide O-acetyltransferase
VNRGGFARDLARRASGAICVGIWRLREWLAGLVDRGLSHHYRSVLGTEQVFLRHPASILHPERIRCASLEAREGLRIDVLVEYEGQTFDPLLVIGRNFQAEKDFHIGVVDRVEIGDDVLVGTGVLIVDHNHGTYVGDADPTATAPLLRPLVVGRPVKIGSKVWIGDGAKILAGADIGDGCVIGANAVVAGIVPPGTIVAGPKAVPVKRFDPASGCWRSKQPESRQP